jgi:hypothetical protein
VWSDWRPVGALQYPYSDRLLAGGKPVMESTVTEVRLNPALPDSLFKKPGK